MAGLKLVFAAVKGELEDALEAKYKPMARAGQAAIKAAGEMVKVQGRADIAAALSPRAANAWRVKVYPQKGESLNASVYAFSRLQNKRQEYAGVFENGATIRGQPLLWIPLPSAPKKIGRLRITPELYVAKIGPLRFVKRPGHNPLLVADLRLGARTVASGRTAFPASTLQRQGRSTAKGARRVELPMFVGVPAVHIGRLTHVKRICQQVRDKLPGLYAEHLKDD